MKPNSTGKQARDAKMTMSEAKPATPVSGKAPTASADKAYLDTKAAANPSAEVKSMIDKVIAATGGKDKILTTFRMEEWFAAAEVAPTGQPRKVTRTSVLQPPLVWWANGKDRGDTQWNEDVWGWSLAALLDAKSIIKPIPDITEEGKPAYGLSITGSLDTEMRLYFSHETNLLVRMDLRNQSYHFSQWKEQDGLKYSSQCVIKKQPANKPWFHHEILSLERLKELPADAKAASAKPVKSPAP